MNGFSLSLANNQSNMNFYTAISFSKPAFQFSYSDAIMLLGSCFVENMGSRMERYKFKMDVNPFGTLYNPLSIASSLDRLLDPKEYGVEDLFMIDGVYHSFDHHSRFSATTSEETLNLINQRLQKSAHFLAQCNRLIVTFGTAWVYRLRETGEVVANCHKRPEREFSRERLNSDQIIAIWTSLIEKLVKKNPDIRLLFTVSPIRHWKDGAHGNQLSKATLLLAIDELCRLFPKHCDYFLAYELLLDELRDYRFYADDMIHPSELAINYIWNQFVEHRITQQSREVMKICEEIQKAVEHRPFNPNSEAYQQFIFQTLLKMNRLSDKFPYFDFSKEKEYLNSKLK